MDVNLDPNRPVIFAADIHLKPQWSAGLQHVTEDSEVGLNEYLRVIKDTNAAAIILGGDIFDQNIVKHVWVQQMFFRWVDAVKALDCRVLAYPGNHDYVLHQLDPNEPVHIHSIHPDVIDIDDQCFFHGKRCYACIGHRDHPAALSRDFNGLPPEVDTLLLHQLIVKHGGSTNLNEVPAHIRTILLGDVHEFSDGETTTGAWWGYPGCMFPQNVVEKDHGVFVVDSDPRVTPMRMPIHARAAAKFDINDEADIEGQLQVAANWVDVCRSNILEIASDKSWEHLRGVIKPVVQLRVSRGLLSEVKKAVMRNETLGDLAHVQIQPMSVIKKIDFDAGEATKAAPTPIDLLPHFLGRIKEQPATMKAHCPNPDASAALVRELLISGGAGRKAGDDERRADGKPLAHKALIAAALAEFDESKEDA